MRKRTQKSTRSSDTCLKRRGLYLALLDSLGHQIAIGSPSRERYISGKMHPFNVEQQEQDVFVCSHDWTITSLIPFRANVLVYSGRGDERLHKFWGAIDGTSFRETVSTVDIVESFGLFVHCGGEIGSAGVECVGIFTASVSSECLELSFVARAEKMPSDGRVATDSVSIMKPECGYRVSAVGLAHASLFASSTTS